MSVSRAAVARWHRWMGLALSAPLAAWLLSALAMHLIVHDAPNGLQGVYDLSATNSITRRLDAARVPPTAILREAARLGVDRAYAIRLEAHGDHLLYVVRPTPYALAMTFDAETGARLDPLSDSLLLAIAAEHLEGTTAVRVIGDRDEYHRDYDLPVVPAARIEMGGDQPSELIVSRASGRPLRRLDAVATGFEAWYRALHVLQWGGAMGFFTTVLFVLTVGVVILGVLGIALWVWRFGKRRPAALTWHGRAGMTVGVFLIVEVLAGAYMWLSLGPLQDPFRGKSTFALPSTGLAASDSLADPVVVLEAAAAAMEVAPAAIQMIEWRLIAEHPVWIVRTARNEVGTVFRARSGTPWDPVPAEAVGGAVQQLMAGAPAYSYEGEREYYWNDLNRPIPVYHFRFNDGTDVYASQATAEIVSRRTSFWRAFSPFLMVHSAAFTRDASTNAVLLLAMLGVITVLVGTGWWAWWQTRPRSS